MIDKIKTRLEKGLANPQDMLAYLAIITIGYAFYNPALRFVPVDFDDLVLLSVVKNTINPLRFFFQDWGFGNYGYRPLHSLSLWLGYQIFGVSSGPNQLINILLHLIVISLLYALIKHLQPNRMLAFIFANLSMVSLYTLSPPTWVSDRPSLLVAICLLVSLNYLARRENDSSPNAWLLAGISIFALMSKESGLIVPIIAAYTIFTQFKRNKKNARAIIALLVIPAAYILFRFAIFGAQAGEYSESGYLFGIRYYESARALTGFERVITFFDNALKNAIAVFLPIFDGQGKISLIGTLSNTFFLVGCTALLAILSLRKKISAYQKVGLAIIILNAFVHMQVFRYRTLYLAQIGFCIFLGGMRLSDKKRWLIKALPAFAGIILLMWNIHIIGEDLTYQMINRFDTIKMESFQETILDSSSLIDAQVVSQIIQKYRH
ncbi:MAG: glycosyltransferase family 39 protein [Anaerolineaceae bacterium]|nr:glycosyltransferase family 39 protein [Anaerolineaceae bacterium]